MVYMEGMCGIYGWEGREVPSLIGGRGRIGPMSGRGVGPMSQCIMITWGPPLDRMTDGQTFMKTLPSQTSFAGGNNIYTEWNTVDMQNQLYF